MGYKFSMQSVLIIYLSAQWDCIKLLSHAVIGPLIPFMLALSTLYHTKFLMYYINSKSVGNNDFHGDHNN